MEDSVEARANKLSELLDLERQAEIDEFDSLFQQIGNASSKSF